MFTKLGTSFNASVNTALQSIIFPTTIDVNAANFSTFLIYQCGNLINLDLSKLTKLGGSIRLYQNFKLESLTFPPIMDSNALPITMFYCYSNSKITSLDLSSLKKLGGDIQITSNTLQESVTFPTVLDATAPNITNFRLISLVLPTSFDISMFTKLGGIIYLCNCNTLLNLILPTSLTSTASISALTIIGCKILNLNLSIFTKLTGTIQIYNNAELVSITFPNNSATPTGSILALNVYSCPKLLSLNLNGLVKFGLLNSTLNINTNNLLTEIIMNVPVTVTDILNTVTVYSNPELVTLDLRGFTNLGGNFSVYSNNKLSSILIPTTPSNNTIDMSNGISIYSNPLITTLNLSTFKKINTYLRIRDNANLTSIIFSAQTSTANILCSQNIEFKNNNLIGTLDLSMFTNMRSNASSWLFDASNNPNLNNIIFPSVAVTNPSYYVYGRTINLQGCALTEASIENLLLKMKTYYDVQTSLLGNVTLQLQGGTNAHPNAQSLTYIANLQARLITLGRTFTCIYN